MKTETTASVNATEADTQVEIQVEDFEPTAEDREWWHAEMRWSDPGVWPEGQDDDPATWAEQMARWDDEDAEWLECYRGAVDAVMEALARDDGRVTDEDVARGGAVG